MDCLWQNFASLAHDTLAVIDIYLSSMTEIPVLSYLLREIISDLYPLSENAIFEPLPIISVFGDNNIFFRLEISSIDSGKYIFLSYHQYELL